MKRKTGIAMSPVKIRNTGRKTGLKIRLLKMPAMSDTGLRRGAHTMNGDAGRERGRARIPVPAAKAATINKQCERMKKQTHASGYIGRRTGKPASSRLVERPVFVSRAAAADRSI